MRKHTGEKPYGCEFCTKRFARSENCKEHERLHTKEKPFLCELCGMSFSDSGNFSKHKRTHTKAKKKRCGAEGDKLKIERADTVELSTDFTITNLQDEEGMRDSEKPLTIKIDSQPLLVESVTAPVKEMKEERLTSRKTRKRTSSRKSKKNACTNTTKPTPESELICVAEESPQPLTLNVLRQPIILTKPKPEPMPVTFNNVVVPLSEPEKMNQVATTGFIKLTPQDSYLHNLTSQETLQSRLLTDPCFNQGKPPTLGNNFTLMNNAEALKMLSYQLPVLDTQPATSNSLLADLNYPANGFGMNSNQTFMVDYFQRDSSFSFANDGSLIVQATNFDQITTASNPTNSADVMYNTSLVPSDLVDTDTNPTSALCGTDFTLGNANTPSIFTNANDYDDELSQPLDTNKFLNEQYLVKKTDPELLKETITESPVDEGTSGSLDISSLC